MIIGIDPGKHGAIAAVSDLGVEGVFPLDQMNSLDIKKVFVQLISASAVFVEDVHASPQMGVVSAFTFGRGFGLLEGFCYSFFPYKTHLVRPQVWQSALGCLAGGDKKKLYEFAKLQFADAYWHRKFNRNSCDAVLIALYGHKYLKWNPK